MRLLKEDRKTGFVHARLEAPEDLWLMSRLLVAGDQVRGSTERKMKIGGEDARHQKVVRKKMTLTLTVEKASYEHDSLRVLGTIVDGPEEVARGDHHSLVFQPGDEIKVTKRWASWERNRLVEATERSDENIIAVLFDREEATIFRLREQGQEVLARLRGEVAKKDESAVVTKDFWHSLAEEIARYEERFRPQAIIAASPAFWREYLERALPSALRKKVVLTSVSDTQEQSLKELRRRPEVRQVLERDRARQEEALVEELLVAVMKDRAAYGLEEVRSEANQGNLSVVAVSDQFLMEEREKGRFETVESVLREAEQTRAKVVIITSKDASQQVDGLGGIVGRKRW